jgi:GT2 family glycosyltransferase
VADLRATDLAVVIPTRGRPGIVAETLAALRASSVQGFDTIVVVDGLDQPVPDAPDATVLVQEHGGPGSARNRGVAATTRPLVLFLGDDMVPRPDTIEAHLGNHGRHPGETSAVLGRAVWHPRVPRTAAARWLEWSRTQFDFERIDGENAGWGRFYSCNVSLKRTFFLRAGGFDEDFTFDYEDLDCAWRLHEIGLDLWYESTAIVDHLHPQSWETIERRYASHAPAERLMLAKHPSFEPYFRGLVDEARGRPRVNRIWRTIAEVARAHPTLVPNVVTSTAMANASISVHQQLAPPFLAAWYGDQEREEIEAFRATDTTLADALREHDPTVVLERAWPTIDFLRARARPGGRLLCVGDPYGTLGLVAMSNGWKAEFLGAGGDAERFLRWRLARRGLTATIHRADGPRPDGLSAVAVGSPDGSFVIERAPSGGITDRIAAQIARASARRTG